MQLIVPDLGDVKEVTVIEVQISPGQSIGPDDALITVETEKATMDVPASSAGTVTAVLVKVGDKVSTGSIVAELDPARAATSSPAAADPVTAAPAPHGPASPSVSIPTAETAAPVAPASHVKVADGRAGPAVRRLARELGINLAAVNGTGLSGRITKADLLAHVAPAATATGGQGIPPVPEIDFAAFGPIRTVPMSRIKKVSGPHLHRAWLNVPHVTHCDEADITELDAYRRELGRDNKEDHKRITLLGFLLKASAAALRRYPEVGSSLSGDSLILKDYVHIGVAVDTRDGLVVPVVRDVDRKGITELSSDIAELAAKARDGKLSVSDMQGATFTISSLGGIGGTSFTPIVNTPEVAILGVVRSVTKPVWDGEHFQPRLVLPLCLSYDHRVIDGALAARFTRHLATLLEDLRRLVL